MRRKPFLKWAGNKYRLLDRIVEALPEGLRFVEPFAGSCAIYLNMHCATALIADINADLINLYQCLQREGEGFIRHCRHFFTATANVKEVYLDLREQFNNSQDCRERAALLLYLNRHGFNGLVRYNAQGRHNVPFGSYRRPYFPLEELRAFYRKTQETETEFVCLDFRAVFAALRPGDVVYCDPPYAPLADGAVFTAYAREGFSSQDHKDLAAFAQAACRRGIPVLLSNHDTRMTRSLYAAAQINNFSVQRFISCRGDSRVAAPELLALYR